jgi:hypothetical protein
VVGRCRAGRKLEIRSERYHARKKRMEGVEKACGSQGRSRTRRSGVWVGGRMAVEGGGEEQGVVHVESDLRAIQACRHGSLAPLASTLSPVPTGIDDGEEAAGSDAARDDEEAAVAESAIHRAHSLLDRELLRSNFAGGQEVDSSTGADETEDMDKGCEDDADMGKADAGIDSRMIPSPGDRRTRWRSCWRRSENLGTISCWEGIVCDWRDFEIVCARQKTSCRKRGCVSYQLEIETKMGRKGRERT